MILNHYIFVNITKLKGQRKITGNVFLYPGHVSGSCIYLPSLAACRRARDAIRLFGNMNLLRLVDFSREEHAAKHQRQDHKQYDPY